MLCPEVSNFKAPHSNLKARKGTFDQPGSCEEINNFYFNHLVSVVLPDTVQVPESISESLVKDCEYYKVSDISVAELVEARFLNNFVKRGNLTGFSINRRIDCDDCVAITPTKKLILSLVQETYQQLGLEGKQSKFLKKGRYIVSIDLNADSFSPGKANYERAKKCLEKLQHYTFIFAWAPPDEKICPSSLAKYFYDANHDGKLCKPRYNVRTAYNVKVPQLDLEKQDLEDFDEIVEWIGMLSIDGYIEDGSTDGFLSSYETPEPNQENGQVKLLQWRGFFVPGQINKLVEKLRDFIKSDEKQWISVYVQGFSDLPINWKENEHHFYTNGDNGYVILLDPKDKYIVTTNKCSNKNYK